MYTSNPVSSLFTMSSEFHHVLLPMHKHSSLEHGHSFHLVLLLLPLRWSTCQRKSFKHNTDHDVFCPGLLDFILLRIKSRILSTVDRAYVYLSMTGFPVSFSTFHSLSSPLSSLSSPLPSLFLLLFVHPYKETSQSLAIVFLFAWKAFLQIFA